MVNDLRYAIRMLFKSPGFTAVGVLTLGLGIGATTAIFSVINALMLRTLPVRKAEQLALFKRIEASNRTMHDLPYPMFEQLRDQQQVFSDVSANWLIERSEKADRPGAEPGQIRVGMTSGNYFSTLGVEAELGRTLRPDDNRVPGAHAVTVISHSYWERRFALAPDVVGRTLTL